MRLAVVTINIVNKINSKRPNTCGAFQQKPQKDKTWNKLKCKNNKTQNKGQNRGTIKTSNTEIHKHKYEISNHESRNTNPQKCHSGFEGGRFEPVSTSGEQPWGGETGRGVLRRNRDTVVMGEHLRSCVAMEVAMTGRVENLSSKCSGWLWWKGDHNC